MLREILNYLVAGRPIHDRDRDRDLASVGRTCGRFYDLAMPLLWEEIWVGWSNRDVQRFTSGPVRYMSPNFDSKRALSYVRVLRLNVFEYDLYRAGEEEIDQHLFRLSDCRRMFTDTDLAINHLHLCLGLFDHLFFQEHCRVSTVEAINDTTLQLLKYVTEMELGQFTFELGERCAPSLVEEIFSIIRPKTTHLILPKCLEIGQFERLMAVTANFRDLRIVEESFWLGLSGIPTLQSVKVTAVPLPFRIDLHFPQLVHLELLLGRYTQPEEFARSFIVAFKHMPRLRTIYLEADKDIDTRVQADLLQISTVCCHHLEQLHLDCLVPDGFLSTIAKDCPSLTTCTIDDRFGSEDEIPHQSINDQDLRQLSLSCRNLRLIRLPNVKGVTAAFEYLPNLTMLETLELHYALGLYMQNQTLLKFAQQCPKLDNIVFGDRDPNLGWSQWRQRLFSFEIRPVKDLFPAIAEPFSAYLEPKLSGTTIKRLDSYVVRLDNLREDMLKGKVVAEQMD